MVEIDFKKKKIYFVQVKQMQRLVFYGLSGTLTGTVRTYYLQI